MAQTEIDLTQQKCQACEGGVEPLDHADAEVFRRQTPEWVISDDDTEISRTYTFKDFYQTMAFVNALAWIAHTEDHHPDFTVGYKTCHVRYSTHAIKGLSINDFICAAKIDALLGR